MINPGNITGQGTHGVPLVLTDQFPIGTHLTVSMYDEINPTCTILNRPVLSPGACSVPNITCDITSPFLDDQLCHDNNTPSNSVDDYISFILNPSRHQCRSVLYFKCIERYGKSNIRHF